MRYTLYIVSMKRNSIAKLPYFYIPITLINSYLGNVVPCKKPTSIQLCNLNKFVTIVTTEVYQPSIAPQIQNF